MVLVGMFIGGVSFIGNPTYWFTKKIDWPQELVGVPDITKVARIVQIKTEIVGGTKVWKIQTVQVKPLAVDNYIGLLKKSGFTYLGESVDGVLVTEQHLLGKLFVLLGYKKNMESEITLTIMNRR